MERRALARLGVERGTLTDSDYERIEDLASLRSQRVALSEGLASLSVEHREALQLRIVEERPYAELASALGITEQTARARVSRALRTLAKATEQTLEGTPGYV